MTQFYPSSMRGQADHGWLKSAHSFSFADFYDPGRMGFRTLRVINDDHIAGGQGFGMHPHRDMEIITYVVEGELRHRDSMGTSEVIRPGEVQRMSAGAGITHSEYNEKPTEPVHLYQIWILPKVRGGKSTYAQKSFDAELAAKDKVLVVSGDGREGSIDIKQDVDLWISRRPTGAKVDFEVRPGRGLYVQTIKGRLRAGSQELQAGDALIVQDESAIQLETLVDSEILVFDLA